MTLAIIEQTPFPHQVHEADFCVVGGGMTGICAALAAARRGVRTILIHDRPVLGGNASSEVGVHIIGADRVGAIPHMRETGILEELRLRNHQRNPQTSYEVWSLVLYDAARTEPNLTVLYNCSVLHAGKEGERLDSVTGWQLTTQTWHTVRAKIFADCSGDAVLAPLAGAPFRMGREAREEFGESIAPEKADRFTMGMNYIYYSRDHGKPMPFIPFSWARKFDACDSLPFGAPDHRFHLYSPWWCELGGEDHSIYDTEAIRDRCFEITFGLWDHIKNGSCRYREEAANAALDQVKFIPGKRESRRYKGVYMLSQSDIESQRHFDDVVAYGGWTMDDHHPAGFEAAARGFPCTIHHPAPSPYGIPFRCFYGEAVPNLMFGGRVASFSHAALSSTRVMGTCSSMGQAIGTGAALAIEKGVDPAGVLPHVQELQQMLLADDAWFPGVRQVLSELTRCALLSASCGDPEPVRDGYNRQIGGDPHCWTARVNDSLTYRFSGPRFIQTVRLTLDTAMERSIAMRGPGWSEPMPKEMPRAFRVQIEVNRRWETVMTASDHFGRHVVLALRKEATGVRFILDETWGAPESRVYAFTLDDPGLSFEEGARD